MVDFVCVFSKEVRSFMYLICTILKLLIEAKTLSVLSILYVCLPKYLGCKY